MVEVGVLLRMLNLLVQPWLLKDRWMDGRMDGLFKMDELGNIDFV